MSSNYPSGASDSSLNAGESSGRTGSTYQSGVGDNRTSGQQTGEALRTELSNLKSDLDTLMSRASTLTDRELSDAKDRLLGKYRSMRYAAKGMADQATQQFNQGVEATTDYVKDRPLQALAIATGIGLLLGAVLRPR
jgi:ElaB/YqjD/DUF883 family membrane-anchored ribosome-binding protein